MSDKNLDVAVIGNIGIDTNVYFYTQEIDFEVEANFTQNIDYLGQAGGYTGRGYAKLGWKTAFIGYVGDDFSGQFIRQTLVQDGLNTQALFIDPTGTSRSVNFMYPDGRRKNFYDGKAHMNLQPDLNLCRDILRQSRVAHFNIPNWARYLLPIAQAEGVKIACDIQDVVSPADPYRQDFIQAANFLFFSAVNHTNPAEVMHYFWQINPHCIFVSGMGARGCALGVNGQVQFFGPVDLPNPVVDTNGAGDGLAVGFLSSYLLEGYSLEEAIYRGQLTARHTCSIKASTDTLISAAQLNRYSGRGKP